MGYKADVPWQYSRRAKGGIQIDRCRIDTENIRTLNRIKTRTQIRFEFLKDAKFRIYFRHNDTWIYNRAREFLEHHKCVYTTCLGLSEHIANFKFIGEIECTKVEDNNFVKIDSAIPIPNGSHIEIDFEMAGEYFSETLPVEMEPDRIVRDYSKIAFERNGASIAAKVGSFWELENNERITFL